MDPPKTGVCEEWLAMLQKCNFLLDPALDREADTLLRSGVHIEQKKE